MPVSELPKSTTLCWMQLHLWMETQLSFRTVTDYSSCSCPKHKIQHFLHCTYQFVLFYPAIWKTLKIHYILMIGGLWQAPPVLHIKHTTVYPDFFNCFWKLNACSWSDFWEVTLTVWGGGRFKTLPQHISSGWIGFVAYSKRWLHHMAHISHTVIWWSTSIVQLKLSRGGSFKRYRQCLMCNKSARKSFCSLSVSSQKSLWSQLHNSYT